MVVLLYLPYFIPMLVNQFVRNLKKLILLYIHCMYLCVFIICHIRIIRSLKFHDYGTNFGTSLVTCTFALRGQSGTFSIQHLFCDSCDIFGVILMR